MNKPERRIVLTGTARTAIASRLDIEFNAPEVPDDSWYRDDGASFVTLHLNGNLRGCIGSLVAHQPLIEDVRDNAVSAAFKDPRFPPLSAREFPDVHIEVSVLTAPEAMQFTDETDALSQLQPKIDGVIFTSGQHKATFLPQVWEQLPTPEYFMAHLKQKAGLPAAFWSADVKLERYRVEEFAE